MSEFLVQDGEAVCPCGGEVYRMLPTTAVQSLHLDGKKFAYYTEDYDDEPQHATFECGDCNKTLLLPAEYAGVSDE